VLLFFSYVLTESPNDANRLPTACQRVRSYVCSGLIVATLFLTSIDGNQQTQPALGSDDRATAQTATAQTVTAQTVTAQTVTAQTVTAQTETPRHPFPLAGKVTIDGRAPGDGGTVIVMLNGNVGGKVEPYCAFCNPDGTFRFEGGHSPGRFVITIAQLRKRKRVEWTEYVGPDALKNLYNDPDKNARRPEFVIHHAAPGKTDYRFDLKVAGVEPAQAGPRAFIHLEFQ
jgi:hypothetical protein